MKYQYRKLPLGLSSGVGEWMDCTETFVRNRCRYCPICRRDARAHALSAEEFALERLERGEIVVQSAFEFRMV